MTLKESVESVEAELVDSLRLALEESVESVESESVKSVKVTPTIMISVVITYRILILKWNQQIFTQWLLLIKAIAAIEIII